MNFGVRRPRTDMGRDRRSARSVEGERISNHFRTARRNQAIGTFDGTRGATRPTACGHLNMLALT
jgi:hypothetical protein